LVKLLPRICRISASILLTLLKAGRLSSFMIDSVSLRPLQLTDVCFTYSTGEIPMAKYDIPDTSDENDWKDKE